MTLAITLLVLRILSAFVLLAIVGVLFLVMWRDYHSATLEIEESRRVHGQLIGLREIDEQYVASGEVFPLMVVTSIGRAPTNTIRLDDQSASSEHCLLALRDGVWWLEDRNSRNGTKLNQLDVTQPVIVTDGDIINIGKKHFRLEIEGI